LSWDVEEYFLVLGVENIDHEATKVIDSGAHKIASTGIWVGAAEGSIL